MKRTQRLPTSSELKGSHGPDTDPPADAGKSYRAALVSLTLLSLLVGSFLFLVRPKWIYYGLAAYAAILTCMIVTLPPFRSIGERNPLLVNAVMTLCAAFIGVFLGASLSAREASRIDREKVAQLLGVVAQEAEQISKGISIVPDATKIGGPGYTVTAYVHENPQPLPEVFLSILQSEMVLRNISPSMFAALTSAKRSILSVANGINSADSDDKILKWLPIYGRELTALREMVLAEANRLQGEIDELGAEQAMTNAIDKKLNYRLHLTQPATTR